MKQPVFILPNDVLIKCSGNKIKYLIFLLTVLSQDHLWALLRIDALRS